MPLTFILNPLTSKGNFPKEKTWTATAALHLYSAHQNLQARLPTILAEGAIALPVTLSGGVLFAS